MSRRSMSRFLLAFLLIPGLLALAGCTPSDSIQNKGSDTMLEVAQVWAANYSASSVEVSGGGSGVGISSLISGQVDVANCSRAISKEEAETAKERTGKDPVEFIVGYDALAVYVHKDNPLEEITIDQLKQVFMDGGSMTKWSQLGVKIPGVTDDTIELAIRQSSSGTYLYFRESVLGKNGKYNPRASAKIGSIDLVESVANTPTAIGYSGMGYKTDGVKFLKVKKGDGPGVLPSVDATLDKSYPIARPLFMYTLGQPEGAPGAYVNWVRSDVGQEILGKIGYVPLPADMRTAPEPVNP